MHPRHALARIGVRWRVAAAVACLLLAGVSALEGRASPAPAPGSRPVVVAARELPAGKTLAQADLTTVRRREIWPGVLRSGRSLVGHVLASAVRQGEPVTAQRLVSMSLTRGLPTESVALPVDVATDVRTFTPAGSRVDLLAVPADDGAVTTGGTRTAERVGERLLVLAALPRDAAVESGCRLVLAVSRDAAVRIVGLRPGRLFQVVTLPP